MLVKEIMSDRKISVSSATSLVDAARKMRDNDIGCLLVENDERLQGIVTDRDVTCRGLVSGLDVKDMTVEDVMSRDVIWCVEEEHVEDAVRLMEKNQVRRLPVLGNGNGSVVGVLSLGDISNNLSHHLSGEVVAAVSRAESLPPTVSSLR